MRFDPALLEEPGTPGSPGVGVGYSHVGRYPAPQSLGLSSQLDEQEAIEACLEEQHNDDDDDETGGSWEQAPSSSRRSRQSRKKEKQAMATRLLTVGQRPGRDFFEHLAAKLDEYGVATPTVQIEYRGLTVRTEAVVGAAGIPTAGNFGLRVVKGVLGIRGSTQELTILDNLNGVLKPGRCTLLLGPPGSGTTTFLRVLGNRMRGCSRLNVSGDVTYNGHSKDEFCVQRTTALVDQRDNHITNLSVAETAEFAHKCHTGYKQPAFSLAGELRRAKAEKSMADIRLSASKAGPGSRRVTSSAWGLSGGGLGPEEWNIGQLEGILALDEIEQLVEEVWSSGAKAEVVLRLLGLGHCRDTLVGDGGLMQRGISGGERKRLTTAEMVVGPQRVLLMDKICNGLDSATLHSVVSFITEMSHALNLTTVISLLQPSPEVLALFDDLLLLVEGRVLYHGPLAGAVQHFGALGFVRPVRKDVASFLLEITTAAGQMEFATKQLLCSAHTCGGPGAGGLLMPLAEMAARFWSDSSAGADMNAQLSRPFDSALSHPAALEHRTYALTPLQAIRVVTQRQVRLVLRDKVLLKGRVLQVIVVSLIVGSLFFRLGHGVNDARSFYGAAFMAVLFMAMGSMPQIGVVMAQKGVWLKHRDGRLYPGYAHGVAMALGQLPVSLIEATLFSCISFFMVGFHATAWHFFNFWGVVAASNLCLSALFRFLAVLAPNPTIAAGYGGVALLVLILTSGFAIVKGSIPVYWRWAYYCSPFAYAMRAIVIAEFTSPAWSRRVWGVAGASTFGEAALLSFDFDTDRAWIKWGILFLIGAYLALSAVTCIALEWVSGPSRVARLPDPEQLRDVRAAAERRRSLAAQQLRRAAEKRVRRQTAASSTAGGGNGASFAGVPVSRGVASQRGSMAATGGDVSAPAALFSSTTDLVTGALMGLRRSGSNAESLWSIGPMAAAGFMRAALGRRTQSEVSDGACVCDTAVHVGALGELSFTPITLVFNDLRYYVPNPAFRRRFGLLSSLGSGWQQQLGHGAAKQKQGQLGAQRGGGGGAAAGSTTHDGGGGVARGSPKHLQLAACSAPRRRTASTAGRQHHQHLQQQSLDSVDGTVPWYNTLAGGQATAATGGVSSYSVGALTASEASGSLPDDSSGAGTPHSGSAASSAAVNVLIADGASSGSVGKAGSVSSGGGSGWGVGGSSNSRQAPRELELLKGVSGFAVPGKLMALMGGSGAGKTTLMDVICGRKTLGRVTGELLANGRPLVKASWSRLVGYVEQMDVHSPAQTVREALWFSGRLRLDRSVSNEQVRAYVEQVIDLVDLTVLSFSLVGTPDAGLSTEQLKRLTIAVELVANPSVVFMDEPTSGLDARAAAIVMSAVRNVALSGRTVMVTIHKPSIEIFEAFDTLLLLQRGGRVAYFGPVGHESSQLVAYMSSVPGTCPLARGQNPATWMLEVTGGSMAIAAAPNAVDWPAIYAASELAAANAATATVLVLEGREHGQELRMASMYAQPFNVQLAELLRKFWLVYYRTPSYTLARCFLTLVVSFIYGSMYLNAGRLPVPYASMGNIQNIMGIMFSSTNFLGMTNLMSVMPLVGMERVVFYRERGALPYDACAYGIALALVEVPWLLLQAILFVPPVYLMVGFQAEAAKAFYYTLMFLASITFYTIFGQLMVYATPSQQMAQVLGSGVNFTFNLANGFVISYPAMPHYWRWLNRVVPTTWVLYGLGASQLGDVSTGVQFAGRRMPVSKFVASLFGYHHDFRSAALGLVLGYVVVLRVASVLVLKWCNFLRR